MDLCPFVDLGEQEFSDLCINLIIHYAYGKIDTRKKNC